MLKKIASFGLALLIVFSVSACNSGVSANLPAAYPPAAYPQGSNPTVTVIPAPTDSNPDIRAIQRVEGKNVQVKVGGNSGFMAPQATGVTASTYETDNRYYTLDDRTHQIVAINPKIMPTGVVDLSIQELEKMVRELIAVAAPDLNLDALTPNHGSKIGAYFFHWDDPTKQFEDGSHPYIQVGVTGKGELLNYINLIPLANDPTDTVTPDELDILAIQRVEGINTQVKVGGDSGFTLPPFFSSDSFLSRYETDSRYYALDYITHQIIAINSKTMPTGVVDLPIPELEKMVRDLIALAAPDLNLDALTPNHGSKTGTYFFHWDDLTKQFEDGTYFYIQVEVNGKGELLDYINTLPMAR
ncbi:MAG: hypothetical protein HZB19_20745 [Chloroflexi bacterium]|nr:hypothetical protein [Chloroflexota bacterium]